MLFGFTTGFYLAYLIPSVILLALMITARSHLRRQICCSLFYAILIVCSGWLLFLTWVLRDGLGPDSTSSHGVEASQRFVSQAWPLALVAVLFALLAASLSYWTKKRLNKSQKGLQNNASELTS